VDAARTQLSRTIAGDHLTASEGIVVPPLPMRFSWLRPPAAWSVDRGVLSISAGPKTDWFADPAGGAPVLNAPALVARPPDENFTLVARVRFDVASMFDAGVLFVHGDDRTWAKNCLERSPQGQPMIVSVVTRDVSDDCNSHTVEDGDAWLRLARMDRAFAFHASRDGHRWELVRFFALPADDVSVGFVAQSPTGEGCVASFSDLAYANRRLADLRDGT
jgi:regulation of enolase protein 1 (concanavalin A-like superfamily)